MGWTTRMLWTATTSVGTLATPFLVMLATNLSLGPSHHRPAATCSRACHDHGCRHTADLVDLDRPLPRAARQLYEAHIDALQASPLGYQDTNLLVYVGVAPALVGLAILVLSWPAAGLRRRHGAALGALGAVIAALAVPIAIHRDVATAWSSAYWFCTDFCIHAANLLGTTYEIVNFGLFVIGFPLVVVTTTTVALGRLVGVVR